MSEYEYRFYNWTNAVEAAVKHAHILGRARVTADSGGFGQRWLLTFAGPDNR